MRSTTSVPRWRGSALGWLTRHPKIYWVVSLTLIGLTVVMVADLGRTAQAAIDQYGTLQPAAIATEPLAVGDVVSDANVSVRDLPAALVPDGTFSAAPLGQVVTAAVASGEPLNEIRVGGDATSGVAALLPSGTSALAVPIGAATPPLIIGDLVDVLATFDPFVVGDGEPTIVVAESATVVDVAEATITIAVGAAELPRVAYSLSQGRVVLALKG